MMRFQVFLGLGALFFVVGVYLVLPDWPFTDTYTDVVPPGTDRYRYFEVTIYTGGRISGDFSETAGHPVSLYVFDKTQYAMFQANAGIPGSLFSTIEVSTGSYSAAVDLPGAYYIVVGHGVGYGQSSQQYNLTLTIDGTNTLILGAGLATIAVGAVILAAGFDSRRTAHLQPWPIGY